MPPGEQGDEETVREAARVAGVTKDRVHTWIRRGQLPAHADQAGRLVSVAAVRALTEAAVQPRPTPAPREVPRDAADYVPPFMAARLLGVPGWRVSSWGTTGKVATRPGR